MLGENKKILHTGKTYYWQQAVHVSSISAEKDPDPHLLGPQIRICENGWMTGNLNLLAFIHI